MSRTTRAPRGQAAAALLAEKLTQALDKGPERLIFDMAGVPFIDCASARAIVVAGQALPCP